MALIFRTTYETYYRKHPIKTRKPIRPTFEEFAEHPAGGNWLLSDDQVEQDPEVKQRIVDEMYRKRMVSTYTRDYGRRPEPEAADGWITNQIVESAKRIFQKEDVPILGPLVTSRRVFGYMNPNYFKTSLTTYQDCIGRNAYKILDRKPNLPDSRHLSDPFLIYLDNHSRPASETNELDRSNMSPCCIWNLRHCC